MKNLLKETRDKLKEEGYSFNDVVCVLLEGKRVQIGHFIELSSTFNYDSGYGSAKVAESLEIVGKDWWLERSEYDGSEWWSFRTKPSYVHELHENPTLSSREDY